MLVKNKNTMFILAAFGSNKLILMSLLLCKQHAERGAWFQSCTYCVRLFCCSTGAAETLAVQPEGVRLPNQQSLRFLSAGEVPPVALL